MRDAVPPPGPLTGVRVLELADETGQFCGKLLGDLGADVVKIEPPGGESCRRIGPFLDDVPPRNEVFRFGITTRQNAAPRSTSIPPMGAACSAAWPRRPMSFLRPSARAICHRSGAITRY